MIANMEDGIQNIYLIANYLKEMLDIYIAEYAIRFEKFIITDTNLYKLTFLIGEPLHAQNLEVIDGSEIKYISNQIVNYIEKYISGSGRNDSPIKIKHRYQHSIYQISISIKRILKKHTFFYRIEDNNRLVQYTLNRVYGIIKNAGFGGLSKSEFYIKTRFLQKHQRENMVSELIAQNKIKEEFVGNAKKRQKIYYAV